jgi:hypothetical protein
VLANILFGTPSLAYGGILLAARAAGARGQENSLTLSISGSSIVIAVQNPHTGTGDIVVSVPSGTTEVLLLQALRAHSGFLGVASASQSTGDGSAIVAALAKTPFGEATDGLKQALQAALGIVGWDDRQLVATGGPVALLWPAEAQPQRQQPGFDGVDQWTGTIGVGIAFQHSTSFEEEMSILDLFRRGLYLALKLFDHTDLTMLGAQGPMKFEYENELKPEAAGLTDKTTSQESRLRVVGAIPIGWTEPSFDAAYVAQKEWPFQKFQSGLFVEPLLVNAWQLSFDCTSFTLTYGGQSTVVMYSADVTADEIQANLEELSSVGAGNVNVYHESDGDYRIVFGSTLPPLNALTGFAMGGAGLISIIQETVAAVPGDSQAVLDETINTTGL